MRLARYAALALAALLVMGAGCRRGDQVRGHGTIEMDEVDVASLVGGRIARMAVDEGDTVRAGDTLAVLARAELLADRDAQEAQSERAAAQWQDLRSGARTPEILAARAELEAATSQAWLAEADFARMQKLFEAQVASPAEHDRARMARDAAAARRRSAEEQLRLVEEGYRRSQVVAAEKSARAASAQFAAARTRVDELVLIAPADGVVLLRNFEPGELAAAGTPVVSLGDPDRLWMRCYIAAPELPRVVLGAAVEVTVDGVATKFPGRVVEIARSAEFTPRAALTDEERANLVFRVKVALEPTGGRLKAGLPATAHIAAAKP